MRQLIYTVFIINNSATFSLWWKENNKKSQNIMKMIVDLDINRNIVNIKCLSVMMFIHITQHLSKTWSSIHEKVKQHKALLIKKVYIYYVRSSDDNDNDYDNANKENNKKSQPLGTSKRKWHKIQWLKLNK